MRNRDLSILNIDLGEEFPHLARAPIVESVIDFRARAESAWEETDVMAKLKMALPEYPKSKSLRGFTVSMPIQFSVGPDHASASPSAAPATPQDRGWLGLRFESEDGLNLATFARDGFSFSRLQPYKDWKQFGREALRLWTIHQGIAAPSELQRIGVRAINRLDVPVQGLAFDEYLRGMPGPPAGLATSGFMYHDVLSVPGHPYAISLIRTIQAPEGEAATSIGLILDIDVLCPGPLVPEAGKLEKRLAEMRWLKNRVFFGSVTERALDLCR
jgi:uncharacterized protein (TIGR04255 family)